MLILCFRDLCYFFFLCYALNYLVLFGFVLYISAWWSPDYYENQTSSLQVPGQLLRVSSSSVSNLILWFLGHVGPSSMLTLAPWEDATPSYMDLHYIRNS